MQALVARSAKSLSVIVVILLLVAQAGLARAQDAELTGVEGSAYTSPTFGYSLEWDDTIWGVDDAYTDDGYDALYLSSEWSYLFVEGMYFYEGETEQCIDGERARNAEETEVDDLEPRLDDSGNPIEDYGEDYAFAMFNVPSLDDPDSISEIVTIECDVLIPNSALLVITAVYVPDAVEQDFDDVQAVLDTIQLTVGGEVDFDESDVEQIAHDAANDIDAFWEGVFASVDDTYVVPKYVSYQGPIETECGDAMSGEDGPFYCPSDQTIYLDVDFFATEMLPFGVLVMEVVVAHEIGHHVQELWQLQGCTATECGVAGASLAIELQADCLAGAWTQDAAGRGVINDRDVERVEFAVEQYLGDPPGTPKDDPEAHGTGEVRVQMFEAGYIDGLAACGLEG